MKTLCKGLGVSTEHCVFGLFEQCGTIEKSIEDRSILADVLAKFERLELFSFIMSLYSVLDLRLNHNILCNLVLC